MTDKAQTAVKPGAQPSLSVDRSRLLQRKCECGNAVRLVGACGGCQSERLVGMGGGGVQQGAGPVLHDLVQAKLTVGAVGDKYEQEADRVAEAVMRMPASSVQPDAELEEEEMVQRKLGDRVAPLDSEPESSKVPPIVREVLNSSGHPLDPETRTSMESRFGYDFSKVQVHTDTKATQSAVALDALAYTVGQNIVFGQGQYTPNTASGKRLLAHELTHVVQQGHITHLQKKLRVDSVKSNYEQESDLIAEKIIEEEPFSINFLQIEPQIQRQESPNTEGRERSRNCSEQQQEMIRGHLVHARTWTEGALLILNNFLQNNVNEDDKRMVLMTYFINFDPVSSNRRYSGRDEERLASQGYIRNIAEVKNNVERIQSGLRRDITYFCCRFCQPNTLAEVLINEVQTEEGLTLVIPQQDNTVRVCDPYWFTCGNFFKRVSTLIHEVVHLDLMALNDIYEWNSSYSQMNWDTARLNADSYAVFIRQLYHLGNKGPVLTCAN